MSDPSNRQLLETRDYAYAAVQRIFTNRDSQFEIVPFEKYSKTAKLRSQHYNENSFSAIPALCILQVGWYADMPRTADVVWNKYYFLSKQYKEELQGSKDILQVAKMAQGPCDFNVPYQLLLERKSSQLLLWLHVWIFVLCRSVMEMRGCATSLKPSLKWAERFQKTKK